MRYATQFYKFLVLFNIVFSCSEDSLQAQVHLKNSNSFRFSPARRMPAKVKRSVGLFEVTIRNDTNFLLTVGETIGFTDGTSKKYFYQLKPTEQTPLAIAHHEQTMIVYRFIDIIGVTLTGSKRYTNTLIIGTSQPATIQQGGDTPSGTYRISQDPHHQFIITHNNANDALDAGAVIFSRSIQLWDVTIKNETSSLLLVRDEIDGSQNLQVKIATIPPQTSAMLVWPQYYSVQKTRRILINAPSNNSISKLSNTIIISNTADQTHCPAGGAPSGIYSIARLKNGDIKVIN